jgi:hypothetical protein
VPCHIQAAPYFAAPGTRNQLPATLSIFPAYQDSSILNSQTAAAAAAMLSLPSTLPFHPLIPVSLPMIDHTTRHLIMPVILRQIRSIF